MNSPSLFLFSTGRINLRVVAGDLKDAKKILAQEIARCAAQLRLLDFGVIGTVRQGEEKEEGYFTTAPLIEEALLLLRQREEAPV